MRDVLWLRQVCLRNGITVAARQLRALEMYIQLLLQHNQHVNLVSRKDEPNILGNHILHSISPLFVLNFSAITRFMDLGTGGGLPGIPLSIMLPEVHFTLVDSVKKKISVVDIMVRELALPNVETVCARAEQLHGTEKFGHAFDAVICRAVAALKDLISWAAPLLKTKTTKKEDLGGGTARRVVSPGSLIAFKGGDVEKEVAQATLRWKNVSIQQIPLVFHGSEEVSLTDKKLLIVKP